MRRIVVLVYVAFFWLGVPVSAARDLIFADGFETGDPCRWSGMSCWTEADLEQAIEASPPFSYCYHPETVAVGPLSVHLCFRSICGDGSPGCPITASLASADLDFPVSAGQIDVAISDLTVDVDSALSGECEVPITQASLETEFSIGIASLCAPEISEIWDVDDMTAELFAEIDGSDCGELGVLLPLFEDMLRARAEEEIASYMEAEISDALIGLLVCGD